MPQQPDLRTVGEATYRYLPERGEYEVNRPEQPPGFIHLDYAAPESPEGSPAIAAVEGPGVELPSPELSPVCRTSGNRIVLVYAHRPWDTTATPETTLRSIVRRMNWKIADQASQSSEGKRVTRLAVDCDSGGQIRVHDVATANNNFATIDAKVREQLYGSPFAETAVKYLVFDHSANEENPNVAGLGEVVDELRDDHFNGNATNTKTAVVYVGSWGSHVTIHELVHTLGAAQGLLSPKAPNSTAGHHCSDGLDLLCYEDGTAGGSNY
ncbi:MAG TPA: hypothetical protein VGG03_22670, partial [Thermoanaerobaculia bacterium]